VLLQAALHLWLKLHRGALHNCKAETVPVVPDLDNTSVGNANTLLFWLLPEV
jgi:hypothetical protein